MLLEKCGKKNLENYQLHKWASPKGYSDSGFVSGNIFILFSIYILLLFPHPDPTAPSVSTWLAARHVRVSAGAGLYWACEDKSGFHDRARNNVHDCSWLAHFSKIILLWKTNSSDV